MVFYLYFFSVRSNDAFLSRWRFIYFFFSIYTYYYYYYLTKSIVTIVVFIYMCVLYTSKYFFLHFSLSHQWINDDSEVKGILSINFMFIIFSFVVCRSSHSCIVHLCHSIAWITAPETYWYEDGSRALYLDMTWKVEICIINREKGARQPFI